MTDREKEIQQLAIEVLNKMESHVYDQLPKLHSNMELCYYLKQITVRIEVIAGMKYGLEDPT
jgi:hypothetical protein